MLLSVCSENQIIRRQRYLLYSYEYFQRKKLKYKQTKINIFIYQINFQYQILDTFDELIYFEPLGITEIHSRYIGRKKWPINNYIPVWYLLKTKEKFPVT